MSTKQYVCYARVSPRPGVEQSESIQFQIESCQQFAAKQGWACAGGPYSDSALSGASAERPGLWEAVKACKRGHILLVHKLDRLTRDSILFGMIEGELRLKGCRVASVSGEGTDGASPEHELLKGIGVLLAQYNRLAGNARTSSMMKRHQSNGRRQSSACPYGWMIDESAPTEKTSRGNDSMLRMVENPDEQRVIERIKEMSKTIGAGSIATELNRQGVTPRCGKLWYHSTVGKIIRR